MNNLAIHNEVCFYQDPQQLFQACKQGDLEMSLKLLAADIDVDTKDIVRLVCMCTGVVLLPYKICSGLNSMFMSVWPLVQHMGFNLTDK